MSHTSIVAIEFYIFLGSAILSFVSLLIRSFVMSKGAGGGIWKHVTAILTLIILGFILNEVVIKQILETPGIPAKEVDVFILFYLFAPFLFSLWVFSFGINNIALGLFTIVKGCFYLLLTVISTAEYVLVENADLAKLALGFTLSLAVFEAITALIEGIKRIKEAVEEE